MRDLLTGADVTDALAPYLAVDRNHPQGQCWVMGHMVAGLDGTAAIAGRVGALSTSPDQALFRRMRQLADVVLVGAETIRREGYGSITLDEQARAWRRAQGKPVVPPVAVVSRSLRLDWESTLFTSAPEGARTIVVTCAEADPAGLAVASEVAQVVIAGQERVQPRLAVAALADLGHRVAVCEGGPSWLGELAAARRLDELCLTVSPLMGGDPLPVAITPPGSDITPFDLCTVLADGGTLFLRYEAKALRP